MVWRGVSSPHSLLSVPDGIRTHGLRLDRAACTPDCTTRTDRLERTKGDRSIFTCHPSVQTENPVHLWADCPGVTCFSVLFVSVLARNRTWSATFAESRAIQHTPRTWTQYPAEESNLVRRFRRPSCLPHTRRVRLVSRLTSRNSTSTHPFNCRSRARTGPAGLMKASWAPAHLQ